MKTSSTVELQSRRTNRISSAGVTDSPLTSHGVLQTERLGHHLAKSGFRFTRIFASDLQRARITANAICTAQRGKEGVSLEVTTMPILREQDFGSSECQSWNSRSSTQPSGKPWLVEGDPGYIAKETHESMALRTNAFLDDSLLPLLHLEPGADQTVAVVSHGITLSVLWRSLLLRFSPRSVTLGPGLEVTSDFRGIEYLPAWSNTGYLELEITPLRGSVALNPSIASVLEPESLNLSPAGVVPLKSWGMTVRTINSRSHLTRLKRTRGGVGSSQHDERQQKLEGFFKKSRPDS